MMLFNRQPATANLYAIDNQTGTAKPTTFENCIQLVNDAIFAGCPPTVKFDAENRVVTILTQPAIVAILPK